MPVQTETQQVMSGVKSGEGFQMVSSSMPRPVKPKGKKELELAKQLQKENSSKTSPVKPNSKKELELAKQLQKEYHYKGFTSEDDNTTCENPDLKELDEKVKSMIAKSEKKMRVGKKTSHSVCVCKVCGKKGPVGDN